MVTHATTHVPVCHVINVYARIMSSLPATEDLRLTYIPNTILQFPVELRDIMRNSSLRGRSL